MAKKRKGDQKRGIARVEFSRPLDRDRPAPGRAGQAGKRSWYARLALPWKRLLWAILTFLIVVPAYIAGMQWRGEPWNWHQALGVGIVLSLVFLFFAITREYSK